MPESEVSMSLKAEKGRYQLIVISYMIKSLTTNNG